MTQDLMDYPKLVEQAMRSVVREALGRTAEHGLPGVHHFYITFKTGDPGVEISETLRARFPVEMTIVLEHQFWGLEVTDDAFGVTLSFGGRQERLTVPFEAVTAFVDPSVKFGLQFGEQASEAASEDGEASAEAAPAPAEAREQAAADAPETAEEDGQVIPLDEFRRK